MMKKLFFCIVSAGLLTACYEDKGSYDYNFDNMNDIDVENISFTPAEYSNRVGEKFIEIQQPDVDMVQKVEVNLIQTLETGVDHLDFLWQRSYKDAEGNSVKDTLNTPGYVELEFPAKVETTYGLRLEITDRTTGLKYYTALTVKTRPIFKNSLFVLHGTEGDRKLGNVEVIGDMAKVHLDAYKDVFPESTENPFAKGLALSYVTFAKASLNLSSYNSDGTAKVYHPYGLERKFTDDYMLPATATSIVYKQYIGVGDMQNQNGLQCLFSRDGKFYIASTYPCYFAPGPSPYWVDPLHQTDYDIATGTITGSYMIFWDKKHERFLYMRKPNFGYLAGGEAAARTDRWYGTGVSQGTTLFEVNADLDALGDFSPKGKTAVYAFVSPGQSVSEWELTQPYFIFKDDNGVFYHYEVIAPTDEKGSVDSNLPFEFKVKEMVGFNPGVNTGLIMYSPNFSSNYIFYAEGGNVYRYNISNQEVYGVYSAPDGYEVSMMKFRTPFTSTFTNFLGRYLSIALEKNGEGAVTEVRLDPSGDVDPSFESGFYEGFGPIVDLQYAHDFMMDDPEAEE